MGTFIYSYNPKSASAKELAGALGVKRIKHEGSTFKGGPRATVINWGSSSLQDLPLVGTVLNNPEYVQIASNKRLAFSIFANSNVIVPQYSESKEWARDLLNRGSTVVGRKILNGHGGAGIVIFEPEHDDNWDEINDCRLFTMYIPKKEEWRIHCMKDGDGGIYTIGIQRKGLSSEFAGRDDINWKIRNLANGFIFVRNDGVRPHNRVISEALKAIQALNLDFGAVDVIWNEKSAMAYVLEVNTAPGLTGTTVTEYADAFRRII